MNRKLAKRLAQSMADETRRAMGHLREHAAPRPYYLSHLLRDEELWRVQARFGATHARSHYRRRDCLTDVRVGSYRYDQVAEGGLNDCSKDDESYNYVELPYGSGDKAFRHALWRLTDARYREAVESFWRKKADELTYLNESRHLPSFEKRAPERAVAWSTLPTCDLDEWEGFVKRTSRLLSRHARIKTGHVELQQRNSVRVFTNTEGSELIQSAAFFALECYLWLLSENGDGIGWTISHYVRDPSELPDEGTFASEIRGAIRQLDQLSRAPRVRSFSGPVLLDPLPAGLLIHEAMGHRLEGNRLLSSGEGQTFKDSVGELVLPEFLSLYDDPTLTHYEGRSLAGHYVYDDEGVPAARADLIREGRLEGFLSSRAGLSRRHRSNGHARSAYHQRAISRMGVTVLESSAGLDDDELERRLLEEVRAQGAPYGIRIVHAEGGETATEGYNFQAFLGDISAAMRIFPDGRREWIRGVNFVGTPLNAVRSIVAAGNRYAVDNAHCGAESGFVPVSTISPALLVRHLELQSKSEQPYQQYTYPIPWADDD